MQLLALNARRPRRGRRGRRVRALARCTSARAGGCSPACRSSRRAGCRTATPSSRRPPGFTALASSTESPVAAFESLERGIYGIQFHPEVVHTPYGQDVLKTFLGDVCGCDMTWSAASIVEEQIAAHPRPGRRRQGHLRPVGRRRLVRRGAARAPRDRRPAHLRLRRPRPDAQERGRAGHRGLPRPLQGRRSSPSTPRTASSTKLAGVTEPEAKRKIIGTEFIRVFEEEAAKLGDAEVPRPGDAVLGRHRVRRRHRRGDDQVPPQRRRPARRPRVRARRAAARAVQGRGARRRRRARAARAARVAPAVPGPRPGDPHRRRRGDEGAPRRPARRRLHPPGRDPQGRPVPRAVAVVLRPARRAHGRRPGRRAHLRLRRRDPRGHLATTR